MLPPLRRCLGLFLLLLLQPACGVQPMDTGPPDMARAGDLAPPAQGDCPPDLPCEEIPAAYQISDPMTGSYGNYDIADRPRDGLDIRYIVIHDTETTYDGAVKVFQDPTYHASAHYVIRSSDGHVAHMIDTRNVAWHAGNWYYNAHSIGIEHEGYAVEGAKWYTEPLYRASAELVKYLAQRYGIPLDRAHIIGHEHVPGTKQSNQATMHWDPGAFWDWDHYMALLGVPPAAEGAGEVIAIHPPFAGNPNQVTYCYQGDTGDCRVVDTPGASIVNLYTAPDLTSPMVTNPYLTSPETRIFNWGGRASSGQRFVVADRSGDWAAIWFSGQKAWFQDPGKAYELPAQDTVITTKAGPASVPLFGIGYPTDMAAYPAPTKEPVIEKIYDLPMGQRYVATGPYPAAYYWSPTYAATLQQSDHKVVKDQEQYYQISFNHRMALVHKEDVDVGP